MQQRRLGRGLDSLLEISATAANSNSSDSKSGIINLSIEKVYANPDQPRKEFAEAALAELAASIKEKGVIQPILVSEQPNDTYMIIAGERRFRASKLAGKTEIPAIIRNYSLEETMEIALIENLQREDLNPMEEAIAFKNLIDHFSLSQEDIAQKIGKNRSTIANSLRLLKLPESIQVGLSQNQISAGHARALLASKLSSDDQESLFQAIIKQGLSVREAESIAQSIANGNSFEYAQTALTKNQPTTNEDANSNVLTISNGATIKVPKIDGGPVAEKRAPEIWDMEEKLIQALGTKVQIKGDEKTGRIEVSYYSLDDLERIYDLIAKQ